MTLDQLLEARPDLAPFAALMRGAHELHGEALEAAFSSSSDVWLVDLTEASDPRKAA